jgi:hypothetical protein
MGVGTPIAAAGFRSPEEVLMPTRPDDARTTKPVDPQPDHDVTPGEVPEPDSALEGLGKAITAPIQGAADDEEPGPA